LRETTSSSYLDQTKSLQSALEEKQKQIDSLNTSNTELQNSIKDLDERLGASKQSRADADEIISRYSALHEVNLLPFDNACPSLSTHYYLHEDLISLNFEMFPARKQSSVSLRNS
jgi:hypothetical protein